MGYIVQAHGASNGKQEERRVEIRGVGLNVDGQRVAGGNV